MEDTIKKLTSILLDTSLDDADRVAVARVLALLNTEEAKNILVQACENNHLPFDVAAQVGKSAAKLIESLGLSGEFREFEMRNFSDVSLFAYTAVAKFHSDSG